MPKERRLKKGAIKLILKKGRSINTGSISLKYLFSPSERSAFAVIVSIKTAKKAVLRNKLKRRGRAIITKLLPIIREGFLTLIFFKRESVQKKTNVLEREIVDLFKKASILHTK